MTAEQNAIAHAYAELKKYNPPEIPPVPDHVTEAMIDLCYRYAGEDPDPNRNHVPPPPPPPED